MKNNENNILNSKLTIFLLKLSSDFLFLKRLMNKYVEFNKLNKNNIKLLIKRILLSKYFDK